MEAQPEGAPPKCSAALPQCSKRRAVRTRHKPKSLSLFQSSVHHICRLCLFWIMCQHAGWIRHSLVTAMTLCFQLVRFGVAEVFAFPSSSKKFVDLHTENGHMERANRGTCCGRNFSFFVAHTRLGCFHLSTIILVGASRGSLSYLLYSFNHSFIHSLLTSFSVIRK